MADKRDKLRGMKATTVYGIPEVPLSVQSDGNGHLQLALTGGYVSLTSHLYQLSKVERAQVKLTLAQAQEKSGLTSFSGSGRRYAPVDVTPPKKGGSPRIVLSVGGVVLPIALELDPTVTLSLEIKYTPPADEGGEDEDEDEDQDEDQDQD